MSGVNPQMLAMMLQQYGQPQSQMPQQPLFGQPDQSGGGGMGGMPLQNQGTNSFNPQQSQQMLQQAFQNLAKSQAAQPNQGYSNGINQMMGAGGGS